MYPLSEEGAWELRYFLSRPGVAGRRSLEHSKCARLHREAPAYLVGELALRGVGGLALGLLCLAQSPSQRPGDRAAFCLLLRRVCHFDLNNRKLEKMT